MGRPQPSLPISGSDGFAWAIQWVPFHGHPKNENSVSQIHRGQLPRCEGSDTMTNIPSPIPSLAGQSLASEDGFLTKRELSLRLKKTPRCIETWMKRRYLPYIKIGHSVFFRWTDVLAALKRYQVN